MCRRNCGAWIYILSVTYYFYYELRFVSRKFICARTHARIRLPIVYRSITHWLNIFHLNKSEEYFREFDWFENAFDLCTLGFADSAKLYGLYTKNVAAQSENWRIGSHLFTVAVSSFISLNIGSQSNLYIYFEFEVQWRTN